MIAKTRKINLHKCKSKEEVEKIVEAFKNCIDKPKCKDCPWEICEEFYQEKVEIPKTLALAIMEILDHISD